MRYRILVTWLALLTAACGGAGADETQPRTPNPNVPREGLGAGGDIGAAPPRDMPGKGRTDVAPKGGRP